MTKILEIRLQHQSPKWILRTDFIQDCLVWSPCSPRDSQDSSLVPQFKSINSLVLRFLYGSALTSYMTAGKTIALTRQTFVGKVMSLLFNMLPRLDITCDYLGKNINMWKINYNAVYTNKDYLYYASLRKKKSYFSHVKEIIQNLNYWCGLAGFNS